MKEKVQRVHTKEGDPRVSLEKDSSANRDKSTLSGWHFKHLHSNKMLNTNLKRQPKIYIMDGQTLGPTQNIKIIFLRNGFQTNVAASL
jgi:hypothetical protein